MSQRRFILECLCDFNTSAPIIDSVVSTNPERLSGLLLQTQAVCVTVFVCLPPVSLFSVMVCLGSPRHHAWKQSFPDSGGSR